MYEEQRTNILDQILEAPAKERLAFSFATCCSLFNNNNKVTDMHIIIRLSRLGIVKKEKARKVEDQLIQSATTGKLASKVSCLLYGLYRERPHSSDAESSCVHCRSPTSSW